MSLVVLAIGLEAYQVVAHTHCVSGRTLPDSHRSTLGFGAAIVIDALAYLFSVVCLYASGGAWALLLPPLFAHVFYGCLLLFFRALYLRIHDYRMQTIYVDGAFRRSKGLAALLDTSFHLLALVLLIRQAPGLEALLVATSGVAAYLFVFRPFHPQVCVISPHVAGRTGTLSRRVQPLAVGDRARNAL
jgi:hypothetical protein